MQKSTVVSREIFFVRSGEGVLTDAISNAVRTIDFSTTDSESNRFSSFIEDASLGLNVFLVLFYTTWKPVAIPFQRDCRFFFAKPRGEEKTRLLPELRDKNLSDLAACATLKSPKRGGNLSDWLLPSLRAIPIRHRLATAAMALSYSPRVAPDLNSEGRAV